MKFWQRAFSSTLLLFAVCFYVSIFTVSNFSYRTSLNSERERSFGEAYFIAALLEKEIATIIQNDNELGYGDYYFFRTYANYYKNRNIYLELWENDNYLAGNIPESPMKIYDVGLGEQTSTVVEYDKNKYLIVASAFNCNSNRYTLVYAHDLQEFSHEHTSLSRFLLLSGAAITASLAIGLYFLLRRLSKPIENMDEATGRISNGDYSMRVSIQGKDEIAALARKFNSMANEIERKIYELQTTVEQKQRFIDNLAHELRTPLTAIRGYAEYLKNANINEDDRITSIDYIVSEAARIEEMTNKLLDLAEVLKNEKKIHRQSHRSVSNRRTYSRKYSDIGRRNGCGTGDKQIVGKSTGEWVEKAEDYEIPIADAIPGLYQGEVTMDLMPIDVTFTKSDVPQLIDDLNSSKYGAVYLDDNICLYATKNGSIQVSEDSGATWEEYDANDVDAKDFSVWLLKNDPIPGYSMKEMQTRLENGAKVKHIVFESGKEMYFVTDDDGIQIELVQSKKLAAVLIDGQRMMITSVGINPFLISTNMLQSFYDLLVSCDVITKAEAEQDYVARIITELFDNYPL